MSTTLSLDEVLDITTRMLRRVGRLAAAGRCDGPQHPRRRGRRHPHGRPVVPADVLRSRRVRQGRRRRRADGRRDRARPPSSSMPATASAIRRSRRVCEPLVDATRTCGVGVLAITHSYSAGVLGWFVERLAERRSGRADVRQLVVAHGAGRRTSARSSAPIRSRGPRRGVDGPPVVADLSSSAVAWVKVNAAAQAGESIPLGWALDADGQPTTDAQAALAGSMVPAAEPQGFGAGAARRHHVGRRGRLELLVRGVGLRRHRRRAARRRPGGAGDRSDGDDGRHFVDRIEVELRHCRPSRARACPATGGWRTVGRAATDGVEVPDDLMAVLEAYAAHGSPARRTG